MKWRNSKERELLSSGASRDVTLPSKDNPHPDLSDVTGRRHDVIAADIVVGCPGDARLHAASNGSNAFDRDIITDGGGDVMYDVMVSDKQYYMDNLPHENVDQEDNVIQVV